MKKQIEKELKQICQNLAKHSYSELLEKFPDEAQSKLESEIKYTIDLSIESRLKKTAYHKNINPDQLQALERVVSKLKQSINFSEDEINDLDIFSGRLNFLLKDTSSSKKGMADQINNVKSTALGGSFDIITFFNESIQYESWNEFSANTILDKSDWSKYQFEWKLMYMFSNIKSCQMKEDYPLFYPAWQKIGSWFFDVEYGDYDAFCKYFRSIEGLEEPRLLHFASFDYLLRTALRNDHAYISLIERNHEDKKIILKELREDEVDKITSNISQAKINKNRSGINLDDLNTILYGPPGTGKTFSTTDRVVKIVEPNSYNGEFTNEAHGHNKNIYDALTKEHNVFFTTFHQSMSYEDFIEGIKPVMDDSSSGDVSYKITPGIFKIACAKAAYNAYTYNNAPSVKDDFEHLYESFINFVRKGIDNKDYIIGKSISNGDIEFFDVNEENSIRGRSKGSQSQNKSWLKKIDIRKLYDSFPSIDDIQTLKDIKDQIDKNHPRKTELYAAFNSLLEFKKDEYIPPESGLITLPKLDEMVIEFDKGTYTQSTLNHGLYAKPVVLVIDEINRGNVSSIFGELITLIEGDKRMGQENEIKLTLPYSKETFSVPPNLFILGTMNTADRSVEALDTALRRRFNFIEMLPDASLLQKRGHNETGKIKDVNLKDLLNAINERVEVLVDRDHTIGHAFFMGVKTIDDLRRVFANKVIPLLQEYFYGDYGKMEMVMGKAFLKESKDSSKVRFAPNSSDFEPEGTVYQIKNILKLTGDKFDMTDDEFIEALKIIITGKV